MAGNLAICCLEDLNHSIHIEKESLRSKTLKSGSAQALAVTKTSPPSKGRTVASELAGPSEMTCTHSKACRARSKAARGSCSFMEKKYRNLGLPMLLQQQIPTVVFPPSYSSVPPHLSLCLSHQDEPRNMNYTMCGSVHSVSCDDFCMGIKAGSLTIVKLYTTCCADLKETILCPCIQISYFCIGDSDCFSVFFL